MPLLTTVAGLGVAPARVFGVEVDCPLVVPPEGLQVVGLLADGDLGEDYLDVVTGFATSGVSVVIEVPALADVPDVGRLLDAATLIGTDLAILPGADGCGERPYLDRVRAFAEAYAGQRNFAGHLFPVTPAFSHLVALVVDPAARPDLASAHPYMAERLGGLDDDACVEAVRDAFERRYGAEGFREFREALVATVFCEAKETLAAHVAKGGAPF